jgi:hypothetical protein
MTRRSTATPLLAVLAIVLVMLAAYVGGYYWLGRCIHWVDQPWETEARGYEKVIRQRHYRAVWIAIIFRRRQSWSPWRPALM